MDEAVDLKVRAVQVRLGEFARDLDECPTNIVECGESVLEADTQVRGRAGSLVVAFPHVLVWGDGVVQVRSDTAGDHRTGPGLPRGQDCILGTGMYPKASQHRDPHCAV